jgi:mannose-6-phosphate isomerase-like protein (cupin superfamily)
VSHNKNNDIEKGKPFVLVDAIQYVPDSVITKVIELKVTGTVKVIAFAAGTTVPATSAFDTFILVLDGSGEITIQDHSTTVTVGQAIIVPAHSRSSILAKVPLKIMSTIIKSGYEDVTIV